MSWITTTIIFEKKEIEEVFPAKIPLTIAEVFEGDFMQSILQIREVNSQKETQFKRRFQRGDRCFVAYDENQIATHFSWVKTKGEMGISSAKRSFQLTPNMRWIFDCRTHTDYRGKSIYPFVLTHLSNLLLHEIGVSSIRIDTNTKNKASIAGIEKAGFKQVMRVFRLWKFTIIKKH